MGGICKVERMRKRASVFAISFQWREAEARLALHTLLLKLQC